MDEVVDWLVGIDSWQQVVVLALILGYLGWRAHATNKKVKQVKSQVDDTNTAVASVDAGVADVLHEVKNNSGTSMKDAVDRIESGQAELVELFGQHVQKFDEHVEIAKASDERLAALEAKYLDPNDHGL